MRLRHIKGCEDFINDSYDCVSGDDIFKYKGKWNEKFNNNNPIHIEVGSGKGQFIRNMAKKYKDINFIAIEKYQSVLMKAVQRKRVIEKQEGEYHNLLFLSADALCLSECFYKGEVDKIYLNFSDPWPKKRHSDRRLTSSKFLKIYDKILKKDGNIEFKTDNIGLFEYSLEEIPTTMWNIDYKSFDFHNEKEAKDNIMTEYEEKFSSKGQKICKLIASR